MAYGHSFGLRPLKAPIVIAEKRKVLFSSFIYHFQAHDFANIHLGQVAVNSVGLKYVATIALAGDQAWGDLACKCLGNCCLMMHMYSAM